MKVYPLSQGTFTIGHDKIFVPFDEETHSLQERPSGSLLVEVQPFLVTTSQEIWLVDAGLGFLSPSGKPIIYEALSRAGFNPNDVTAVLLSHLHKDHCGGCVFKTNENDYRLAFPHATHFVYRAEANFALEKGKPSFDLEEINYLLHHAKIEWLIEDSGWIKEEVWYEKSGGHSPHHIVFKWQQEGETLFYGGDEAPQLKQLKMRYMAKYDYDAKKAMLLREQYAEQGKKEGWKFLFFHDIKHPVSKL